jgi:hypothetical protein
MAAEPTIAIYPAHPGNADAGSERQLWSRAFRYFADNLMTGNDAQLDWRQVSFDDVKIGAANTTGNDLEEHGSRLRPRPRDIFDRNPSAWSNRS